MLSRVMMILFVQAQAAEDATPGAAPITIRAGQLFGGKGGVRKNVVVTVEGSKIKMNWTCSSMPSSTRI